MKNSIYRWLALARNTAVGLCLLTLALMCVALWRSGEMPGNASVGESAGDGVLYDWPAEPGMGHAEWGVLQRRSGVTRGTSGPVAQRYRLAGTFFAYPGEDTGETTGARRAILDDLRSRQQHLVQEGDDVEEATVVSIFRDRIVLRGATGDEELWLSFTGRPGGPTRTALGTEQTEPLRFEDMPALETSRFGKRIGENRWVFQRDSLMAYADDLQDDPERLTAFFLAMQPDYDSEDEIAGFQLGLMGEDELYQAAGFQEGDVVRMVNSMPMTSPARAQYFIREFLNGRISALVFDIERDGQEEKLIHLIR